jgi:hypothetical protein
MKKLILAATLLALSACSLGKDSSMANTAQVRQNKQVHDLYDGLVGTYEGVITNTNHGDERVQLIVYIDSQSVKNPDGTPGTADIPMAFFRRSSPVIADYTMQASGYLREVGDITFFNLGTDAMVRAIRGKVNFPKITGVVNSTNGNLGDIELTWKTSDTSSRNDLKDRLLRQYQAIEGNYYGKFHTQDKELLKRKMMIQLSAVVNGDTPKLIGLYKRLDIPEGTVDLALTVSYRPDQYPPQITLNGKGTGKYEMNMDGTLLDDNMTLNVYSLFEGNLGTATLIRSNKPPKGW